MDGSAPNVVLLTVDALRADHCSHLGYDRTTTPEIDRLAAANAVFERAISPSSHTREAVPALLSGRDPVAAVDGRYALAAESIAARLADAGYATGGFHSNPYVSRAYGFDDGFDAFDDDLYLGHHRLIALAQRAIDKLRNRHYATAGSINERALSWLEGVEAPFFLWNHYMDPHGPYAPPRRYQEEFHGTRVDRKTAQERYRGAVADASSVTPDGREEMIDCYDGEIRYVDESIEAFLDALRERGDLADTLVVITADHGDGFGEHDFYGHPRELYEELLRVPLVVAGPDIPDVTVQEPVSTIDVVPTILSAAGVPADGLPGRPLSTIWTDGLEHPGHAFASTRGEGEAAARRRFALRERRWKVIVERDVETGDLLDETLFDLERDPGETSPLDPSTVADPDAMSAFETLESRSANRISDASTTAATEPVDPAVEERLEILGYK